MRILLAKLFRQLFKIRFFKVRFFGIYERIFKPYRLFRGVESTINYNGFQLKLKLDDWIQENIFFLGAYEPAELSLLENNLQKGDVFLDLGANLGIYTLHASKKVGIEGKVIAFEPFSINFDALKSHVQLNKLKNVQLEKLAVGKSSGKVDLYLDKKEENLGMVTSQYIENAQKETVEIVSIDDYLSKTKLDKISFIKIDIEGLEYPTLLGMEETLRRFKPQILIEILDDSKSENNREVDRFLSQFGYQKYFIADDGTVDKSERNPQRKNYLFAVK